MSQSSMSCSVILGSPSLFVNGDTLVGGCGTARCNGSSILLRVVENSSLQLDTLVRAIDDGIFVL